MVGQRFWQWKRWLSVVVVCVGLILAWQLPSRLEASTPGDVGFETGNGPQVDPRLVRALSEPSDAPVRVIVRLRSNRESKALFETLPDDVSTVQQRQALVNRLQRQLIETAAPLREQLADARVRGDLLWQRDLWIINSLALEARPKLIRALQRSRFVAELRLDTTQQYVEPIDQDLLIEGISTTWGIERINAPKVWQTLALSGTDAVVAGMDTGIEWQHPTLAENYRGNLGKGLVNHKGAWFDAVNDGIYPYDDHGHGSHTLGTAVGQGGIGVAPGARWIGVKVLDGSGNGYSADIHAGFQWLLAPGGDPALAPDVVVCSWGSNQATSTEFQLDVEALLAAGILPIFAAGNEGPQPNSLRSPASNPSVFAVGASDPYEQVASFSSRGPSPWDEIKPYVVAPGVNILSAAPGGVYAEAQGTSMATPHVAGMAALMRGVSATISTEDIGRLITTTAVPLTDAIPNNDSGWGRVDAYAALVALTGPGIISGTVSGESGRLDGARIQAQPHGAGNPASATTDAAGHYTLALTPGFYDLTATAFGHAANTVWNVHVLTKSTQRVDFTLSALPTGRLQGTVTVAPASLPPTRPVTVQVQGTSVTATVDTSGQYSLALPADDYVVELRGNGYRVVTASVEIVADAITTQNFSLISAPTLLLVDEGAWHYQSQTSYWQAALDTLRYAYDTVSIIDPPVTEHFTTSVSAYDMVLWSSPESSPGLVQAGEVLTDYLSSGGRLLLSGQDVAFFDSGVALTVPGQRYLRDHLSARFLEDNAPARSLTGSGPFSGMTITITGGSGADNQRYPDEISVRDPDISEQVWRYAGGDGGGLAAHICTPYRALFFSFGYEAIAEAATRREVMSRALDWLALPPPTEGLTLTYQRGPRIGLPGEQVTHTFRVRHIGSAGSPDDLAITLTDHQWPTVVTPTEVTLTPCEAQVFTVTATIPADAEVNAVDLAQLNVHSSLLADPLTTTLQTKTPAPVLLVDDDRWYPMEERYTTALDAQGLSYDVWNTNQQLGDAPNTGEIMTETLLQHPIIVWFTGYDWYAPVTEQEEARLLHYLDHGGRLLLTSQDFLYYEPTEARPLGKRMGVAAWVYDRATETAWGSPEHPAGGSWGPVTLAFPFRNWSDAVEPIPDATSVARGDDGQPLALAHGGETPEPWRSLFYGFPLETLPLPERGEALANGIGWLSPLGRSTWSVTPTSPAAGDALNVSLVLHNDGPVAHTVTITHTVPPSIAVSQATLPPDVTYEPSTRHIRWTGTVAPDTPVALTWDARVNGDTQSGQPLTPTVTIALADWGLALTRTSALRVDGVDLSSSTWLSPAGTAVQANEPTTLTFALRNTGPGAMQDGSAQVWLMTGLAPITATLPPTQGTSLLLWQDELASGATHPISLTVRPWIGSQPLRLDALLNDGTGQQWTRSLWLNVAPWRLYMPMIYKEAAP